mmetsp:Transcript_8201/g.12417  ORF Transcript_8201/g.12417 Transcript_8201/m.12417 type:complete len:87 (+) Transcript_8201:76-336(+)
MQSFCTANASTYLVAGVFDTAQVIEKLQGEHVRREDNKAGTTASIGDGNNVGEASFWGNDYDWNFTVDQNMDVLLGAHHKSGCSYG